MRSVQLRPVCKATGGEVVEVKLGWTEAELTSYLDCWSSLCAPEAVLAHAQTWPSRREDYGNWFREWPELGEQVTPQQIAAARIAFDRCSYRASVLEICGFRNMAGGRRRRRCRAPRNTVGGCLMRLVREDGGQTCPHCRCCLSPNIYFPITEKIITFVLSF